MTSRPRLWIQPRECLVGAGFLAGGREGGPALRFSGFLRVASLSGVTLGLGRVVQVLSDVWWDLSGALFLVAL